MALRAQKIKISDFRRTVPSAYKWKFKVEY